MRVLVDTSIWSLALRRRGGHLSAAQEEQVASLRELIQDVQFEKLREQLRACLDEGLPPAITNRPLIGTTNAAGVASPDRTWIS